MYRSNFFKLADSRKKLAASGFPKNFLIAVMAGVVANLISATILNQNPHLYDENEVSFDPPGKK